MLQSGARLEGISSTSVVFGAKFKDSILYFYTPNSFKTSESQEAP
jgi:hypothetical protein